MKLYNTLSKKTEDFKPLNSYSVTIYSCGPTVYDYTHIGHLKTYVNVDLLKRALKYIGYKVNHVMNITDVGHLTGDDDTGVDKIETGAKDLGKTVSETTEFYTEYFLKSITAVNILKPQKLVKATNHIQDMLKLIKQLKQKGFVYDTDQALYFDRSKFPNYGVLSRQNIDDQKTGARDEVYIDPQKKHPSDFALWFKRVGRFKNHVMHWPSPFGDGFPGWHIECSAMSMKYLGYTIDIHTGGVDHIPIHHTNEIAQSESATGKQFVRFWFHSEFLLVEGGKMSKSKKNFYTVDDIVKKNIDPLALRFLFLQTHYRRELNFTWQSVKAADLGLQNLKNELLDLKLSNSNPMNKNDSKITEFKNKFAKAISDDLNIPQALTVLYEMLKSNLSPQQKYNLAINFDQIIGLDLSKVQQQKIPQEILDLAEKRQQARTKKDFTMADKLRKQIESKGFTIEDSGENFKIKPT